MPTFILFLLMNVLNYVDRQTPSGMLPILQSHFHASDTTLGLLGTVFMVTYSLTAIPFGIWADRWQPTKVAAVGVLAWSFATMLSALAGSLTWLFILRALVGVGEAAYVATGATVLSTLFPPSKRSSVLGWFNLGLPLGGAIGTVLGGYIGAHLGWQWAFLVVGIPGLVLAFFAWRLPFAGSGTKDQPDNQVARRVPVRPISRTHLALLLRNPGYWFACLGAAGVSFAFGAIFWFAPMFFHVEFGYTVSHASFVVGALEVVAGLFGAPCGGIVADFWLRRSRYGRVYTLILAMALSALSMWSGLLLKSFILFALSAFFVLWYMGISTAIIFDVTERPVWNTAQAISLLVMHLFGDVPGTAVVGAIADHSGLYSAFLMLPIPMLIAAVFFALLMPSLKRAQSRNSLMA